MEMMVGYLINQASIADICLYKEEFKTTSQAV